MWYVVQVRTGTEENIRTQCLRKISSEILERCFIPYYEEKKHIRGEWTVQKKVLFPGYVFVVTEDMEKLHESLKSVIGLTRLIGTGREIVPISEEERQFLLDFGGEKTDGAGVGGNYRKFGNENTVRPAEGERRTDPEDRPA